MPTMNQNQSSTNAFLARLSELLAQRFGDANASLYGPVLSAIRSEPDADQYGGPSDMDADNMAGGLAGRMGGGDYGRLGRGSGYVGETPSSGPYAELGGRMPSRPQMGRPAGAPIPPPPPTDMVRVPPAPMVGPPAPPSPPRPAVPLGPGYDMTVRAPTGMAPTDTGYAPMTRQGPAPMGRPVGPMGPFGPFPSRVDVTPPMQPPSGAGAGLPPGALGGALAAAVAPALAMAGVRMAQRYAEQRGRNQMMSDRFAEPLASDASYTVGPRDAGRFVNMPPTGTLPTFHAPPPPPTGLPSIVSPPMRYGPQDENRTAPFRADPFGSNGGGPQADLSTDAAQLGTTGRASMADDVLGSMMSEEGDPRLNALRRALIARQARGGV